MFNDSQGLNTGAKGILKMGGVGGGKVLVWETIHGRWSGQQAADMYEAGLMLSAAPSVRVQCSVRTAVLNPESTPRALVPVLYLVPSTGHLGTCLAIPPACPGYPNTCWRPVAAVRH